MALNPVMTCFLYNFDYYLFVSSHSSSDLLAAVTAFSQGHLLRGLETTTNILGNRSPGDDASSLPTIDSSSLLQISEQINRNRLHEYGLR